MSTAVALLALLSTFAPMDWNPEKLYSALTGHQDLSDPKTVQELTTWFGGEESLAKGARPIVKGRLVAVAMTAPPDTKRASFRSDGSPAWPDLHQNDIVIELQRVGKTRLFVGASPVPDGTSFEGLYQADDKTVRRAERFEAYETPLEAMPEKATSKGKLVQRKRMTSQIFGGTWHDWWVYTSPDFDVRAESNLVVFQDGQWAHSYAPTYFDNLCSWGGLKQTVVVCVTPGTFPDGKSDRSREYDTLSDAYSRFLLEELLPPVEAELNVTQDPTKRCVAGLSSGGVCSFTVAWNRPDKFGLVLSWIGSFTNIASGGTGREGGHNYPALIRKTERKPIKVFLQDGANDLENEHGNWWLSNLQMAKALEFKGYPVKKVWGFGGHTDLQGRATMPGALRWLFGVTG
ncbi:MAG: enterochelin esterase [Armatimonadetes bacterium]|nr:enterochelin esterase [Armatimonadota bacterium]